MRMSVEDISWMKQLLVVLMGLCDTALLFMKMWVTLSCLE